MNKLNNEFNEIQAPQEIAGFFFVHKRFPGEEEGLPLHKVERGSGEVKEKRFYVKQTKLNLTKTKRKKLLRHLQHTRFMKLDDTLSSTGSYWYALENSSIVPIGNENDSESQRPDCIHR